MDRLTKRLRSLLTGILVLLLSSACSEESTTPATATTAEGAREKPARIIEAIADEYLAALLDYQPELGTYYSIPGVGHDRLTDNSLEASANWARREDQWLDELEAIEPPDRIGSRDWVTYGILLETLRGNRAIRVCRNELWRASNITAWYTELPLIFEIQPVETPDLRQQALDRLRALPRYIDTEIGNLRRGLELGYSAPRLTVQPAVAEARALNNPRSPFLSPAQRADDPDFEREVQVLFDDEIRPAVERFARFLEAEYLPAARESIALSGNPDGADCYPALIRHYATIQADPREVHATGVRQIALIRREMQAIIDTHFPGATIESFLRRLNDDPRYTFRTSEDVLAYSVNALEAARERMPAAFGLLPRADVLIEPYPDWRTSGTGEYHSSSEDGTRPGTYYIAVTDPTHRARAIQQSVLFHETYPGHHLQGAIALELGDRVHPIARYLWNSGYGEGWGLYAERLADELGLYTGPLDRMGMLSDQAARAARLVVDTGMHTLGWTREEALEYMLRNTAWPAVDIESEINRYIAWPGQATSYMLGMLEIRRLRQTAESELGSRFDLRAFHDRVLENGSVTLPMLAQSVYDWIRQTAAGDGSSPAD